VTEALSLNTPESTTGIVREGKIADWTTEAINSPSGVLAQSLFDDPRTDNLEAGVGLSKDWLLSVERLLVCRAAANLAR